MSRLAEFFDALPGYVWSTRPEGGFDSMNRGMLNFIGSLTDELKRDWRFCVHPQDRPQLDTAQGASRSSNETVYPPLRLRRHDGAYRWFQCSSVGLEGPGIASGARCTIGADIHDTMLVLADLRHRESAIRAIVECIPGFVWQLGPGGELQYLNTKVFEYTGKTLEGLREPGWRDSLHPDDIESFIAQWKAAMQANTSILVEFRLRRADGVYRWFRTIGGPIRDAEGHVTGWCGVDIDTDEEKRVAQRLKAAQSQLERSAQLAIAAELTASTANAVNQPLAAIVANAFACQRWLSSAPPNIERAAPIMNLIVQDSKAAAAIVSRILAIIRRSPPQQGPLEVNTAIDEALRLLTDEIKETRITVQRSFTEALPLISANRALFQQVLVNVLRNSIDALKSQGDASKSIVIQTLALKGEVLVEVADNGIGFREGSPLFDAFYTTKEHALGLGLAVARSIIESYAGRVWALHNSPTGAIIGFAIPAGRI